MLAWNPSNPDKNGHSTPMANMGRTAFWLKRIAGGTALGFAGIFVFAEVISPTFRFVKGYGNAVCDSSTVNVDSSKSVAELTRAQLDMFGIVVTARRVAEAEDRAAREKAIDASINNTAANASAAVKQAEIHKEEVTNLANAELNLANTQLNLANTQLKQTYVGGGLVVIGIIAWAAATILKAR